MKNILFVLVLMVIGSATVQAQSRNRLSLEDTSIRGELRNDDRLLILARQRSELKNYVKFRTTFREEILQEWPQNGLGKSF